MTILEYIDKLEKEKRLQYHAMQEQRRARLIRPEKEARHDPTTEEMNQRPQISIKRMPAGTATTLLTVMRTCAGLSLTEKIVDVKGVNANASTSELNEDEIKMIAQSMTEQASVESETNPICGVPTEQDGKMRDGEESSMDVRVQHDETQQDDIVSRQDTPSIRVQQGSQGQCGKVEPHENTPAETKDRSGFSKGRHRSDTGKFTNHKEEAAGVQATTQDQTHTCLNCRKVIVPERDGRGNKKLYCCKRCRDQYVRVHPNANEVSFQTCAFCGKEFQTYRGGSTLNAYCSVACTREALLIRLNEGKYE